MIVNGELCQRNSLEHHGIKGMKWGEKRYQTGNGTWTPEGLARRKARGEYGDGSSSKGSSKSSSDGKKSMSKKLRDMGRHDEDLAYAEKQLSKAIAKNKSAKKIARIRKAVDIEKEILRAQKEYIQNDANVSRGRKIARTLLTGSGITMSGDHYKRLRAAGYGKVMSYLNSRTYDGEGYTDANRHILRLEYRAASKRLEKAEKEKRKNSSKK